MTWNLTGGGFAALCAGMAFAAPAPPVAPGVHAGRPVRLPGSIDDLVGSPDGSLRAATSSTSYYANGRLTTIDPLWKQARSVVTLPEQNGDTGTAALTAGGVVNAFRSTVSHPRRIKAAVYSTSSGRARSHTVSDPAQGASDPHAYGGGDAVAVIYRAGRASDPALTLTFKPAGSNAFTKPVPLDAAAPNASDYDVALGADGSGVIVASPSTFGTERDQTEPVRVQRIARDGTLGPWFKIGERTYGSGRASAAIGSDGTIAVAMAMSDANYENASLETARVPPGAEAALPVELLASKSDTELEQDNLTIAIGPSNETVVATAGISPHAIDVYTGPAGALTHTGTFDSHEAVGTLATVTADAGVTVAWQRSGGSARQPLLASHQPPGGTFSKPAVAAKTRFPTGSTDPGRLASGGVSPQALVPLSGGDAALAYDDNFTRNFGENSGGVRSYAVRLRP